MQRVLASILCIVLVFGGIYVPGMTVRAAEEKDLSSWDATDISGGDDIADNAESQPVLFGSEEGDAIDSGTYENITWVIDADGKLTVEGTGEFSDVKDYYRAPWYNQRSKIKTAVIRITGLKDASHMFDGCKSLTSLDLSSFETRNVTDMEGMFNGCGSLKILDLSGFDTCNVTNMSGMFTGCSGLKSLDLSSFDTRNVTAMSSMFWKCSGLTSLDLSSFGTGSVSEMYNMFTGCSSLTSLDLSSFDTHNVTKMNHMFDTCSSLTSLDLSSFDTSSVTTMEYMFNDCKCLTSLDLSSFDTSNVTSMGYMFYDCYNLASIDLSSFDTRNLMYRDRMFSFCRSLKSLDLSSFDAGKVKNDIQMFDGCINLILIYAPYNLNKSISLPPGTWYRSDGSIVEYLPTDLSYSVVLQRDSIPIEKSHFMPDITVIPDKSMLLIMEAPLSPDKTANPLSGAKVTVGDSGSSYTADDTGTVEVDEEGTQTISVEKEGYHSAKVTKDLASGKIALIYLYSLSSEQKTQVLSATMNLTGEEQDVFNGSKSLTLIHKDLSQVTDGEDRDFVITVNAAGSPEKYQLLQNGKIIQESTTGVFTIKGKQVKEQDHTYSNYVEELEAGYKVSVRVFDTDGKFTKHDLDIRVSEASSVSWKKPEIGMELGDKLRVSVPQYIPLLAGSEINLGLEEELPVELQIDAAGKVRIAVNAGKFDTDDLDAWAAKKDIYDSLSKMAVDASGDARMFGDTPQSYGAGMFSVKGSVMGYGEGYLDEKTNSVCVSVGIILKVEGEAAYTQYFFVAFVPFYVTFGGGVSLTASGKLDFSISKDGFQNNGGMLEIEPAIYAKLKGGVGADGILSVGASGKLTLSWLHRFTPAYDKVSLNGNAKITAEALMFTKALAEIDGTWVIYDSNQQSAPALLSQSSIANPDMSGAEIISMDYLDKRAASSAKAGGAMTYSLTNAKESASVRILDYAYRNASPRLLQLEDKLYLFYLDGVEGRSDQNQTALFYQISSDNGVTWSEASRADGGANETADFDFDIATDGTDIYVIWSDAGAVYGDDFLSMDATAAMAKVGREMDLMLAVIDGGTGDVRSTSVIKTEAGDLQPQIYAGDDGAVTVTWMTNDASAADGLLSNANRMGICYASSTSDYQVQTLSLEDGQYPLTLAVGSLGTQVCIAAGLDTDGDLNTQDDRDIYIAYPAESGQLSVITSNEFVDSVPLFGSVGGQNCLFWYREGNIAYTSDGQTILFVLAEENQNSSGQEFSLLESSTGDGEAALVWTTTSLTEENGVDVYCADFDGKTWSAPYRLGALDSEFTTHLDGWMDGTGYHLAYLGKEYADDTLNAHICLDAPKELMDTAVTWYSEAEEQLGKSYPLQLVVMNNGNQTVKSLQISSKDGSIQDVITDLSIAPGTSGEVTWSGVTLPGEMTKLYTQELTIIADGETNAEDNSISLSLGAPDFSIDVYSDFAGGDLYAGVIVTNSGILPSDAIIKIYRDDAHEQEIFSTGIRDIAGGESKLTLLDMTKLHELTPTFYFTVSDAKGMEIYTGDNEAFLYEGKGLWLEYDDGQGSEQPGVNRLRAEKTKTVYEYGETLNVDDLTVTLLGSDGTATETVTDYSTNADSIDMLTLGEKTLTVTYGEYTASVTITVEPCTLKEVNTVVTLPYTSCVYDGTAKEPLPQSVKVNGTELVYATDYTVSWSDNTAIGDATIAVTGQGNYRGTLNFSFAITKEAVEEEGLYTVTFDLNGHGTLPPLTGVKQGSLIAEPQPPKAQGYRFTGWYQDKECTVLWQFDTDVVQENLTLYAGWRIVMGGGDGSGESGGDQDEELSIQEIRSQTYTGKALKPTVCVYSGDGSTPLKAGKDYTIKYYNNIDADTDAETGMGGISSTGEEVGQGFTKQLAYVVITGKGNYKGTVYQNFHIVPASVANKEGDDSAAGFTLKYTNQLTANAKKAQKPFSSLKYKKALRAGKDYEVILTAVTAYDGADQQLASGSVVARSTETGVLPAIPAGYRGSFAMRVNGIGNFTGSFEKTIYVTDKSHLIKNVSVTLGKNQKKTDYTGQNIILRPGYYDASAKAYYAVGEDGTISAQAEANGDNVFTVKVGKEYLLYGRDYTVSYKNHRSVGTATMTLTGKGDYAGSKSVTFQIKGSAFNAKTIRVDGLQTALNYSGKALTQSGVILTEINTSKPLVSGKDYTVTYKNNIKKGTATMIFTAKPSAGYSGSFQKTFRITAVPLADTVKVTAVNTAQDQIVYEGTKIRLDGTVVYTREGAKPSGRIQLCNSATGGVLKEGTDYTVAYQNNTTVTAADQTNQAVMVVKGRNNYTGTLQIGFRISAASLAEESGLKATAASVAFNDKKAEDYEYRPTIKLMDGKKALRAKTDYEVTYVNCTQKAVAAYLTALSDSALTGQSYEEMRPYARIEAKEGSGYQGDMMVDLTIYSTKLSAATLYVVIAPDARQTTYSGRQVTPEVTVYYGDKQAVKAAKQARETSEAVLTDESGSYKLTKLTLKSDKAAGDYTLLYGANIAAGKNKGSVTINGAGLYGGKVTVKFTINSRDVLK
ncbi:MAG: BspA family leucine-rich repeat surface protein [Butyrivibrio sp.]|nr:BspA family leucine-rich repeat surface protein [Butyrivibrio sp.]